MFGDGALTFREFAMGETLPLATIHDAVLDFLRGREDAVVCGPQAVNGYVDDDRYTCDFDVLSTRAGDLADEIRVCMRGRFDIAIDVVEASSGKAFDLVQRRVIAVPRFVRVRSVVALPPARWIEEILVIIPEELTAERVVACYRHRRTPTEGTDVRDIAVLLLKFPALQREVGPVRDRLEASITEGISPGVRDLWLQIVQRRFEPDDPEAKFFAPIAR